MMRYKKQILAVFTVVFFFFAAVMIYRINQIFPNPENISVCQGEDFTYKGLSVTAGNIEIYYDREIFKTYTDLEQSLVPVKNENGEQSKSHHMLVNLKIKNKTDSKISLGKESISAWIVEMGNEGNGADLEYFMLFNPDYDGSFAPGEEMNLKLPFEIFEDYLTQEEVAQSDIKIVYSYYPTKNYIYYPSEERNMQK